MHNPTSGPDAMTPQLGHGESRFEQHDDGPAVAKLFAQIDASAGYRTEVPDDMDLLAMVKAEPNGEVRNLPDDEDDAVMSPVHYAHQLHQAGEAAISILCNMAESEFAIGNPRNMPEPVLGWYAMTLAYQLCVMEACALPAGKRMAQAAQLEAAVKVLRPNKTQYSDGVLEEIGSVLVDRAPMMAKLIPGEDLTYGGKLGPSLTANVPGLEIVR